MTNRSHDEPDNAVVSQALTRRRALALGGAGAVALTGLGATAYAADRTTSSGSAAVAAAKAKALATTACMRLTSEQIEGPYYLDYELFRKNVVEDRTGVPLLLVPRLARD